MGIVLGTLSTALKLPNRDVAMMVYDLLADDLRMRVVDESQPNIIGFRPWAGIVEYKPPDG